jgi:hypothetical protein
MKTEIYRGRPRCQTILNGRNSWALSMKELEIEMKNSEMISDPDSCDKLFVYNFIKSKLSWSS